MLLSHRTETRSPVPDVQKRRENGKHPFDAALEYHDPGLVLVCRPPSTFSQWAPSASCTVVDLQYNCTENSCMTEKVGLFGDASAWNGTMLADELQTKLRLEIGFDHAIWEHERLNITLTGTYDKFCGTRQCATTSWFPGRNVSQG